MTTRREEFDSLFQTLGIGDMPTDISFDATITPRSTTIAATNAVQVKRAAVPTAIGVPSPVSGPERPVVAAEVSAVPVRHGAERITLPTLPRLSIMLPAGESATTPTVSSLDETPHDIQIVRVLGEGGMGRVYLARQRSLQRDVALKTLKSEYNTASLTESLLSEGLITGHLEHPNIIPVHALGHDGEGRPLLVMKRIEGVSWQTLLDDPAHPAWKRTQAFSTDRLVANLEILQQVCNALHYAHSRGVLHRDVKPENVMIGEFGEVYLVDWGIARRFPAPPGSQESMVGTPTFMAPEMVACDAEKLGPATDVFLLGATLHAVLTGTGRHQGSSLQGVLFAAYECAPVGYPADVPVELAALCNRATHRDPADRPASAQSFRQVIVDYLAHQTSIDLATEADRTCRALEQALADETDSTGIARLATECRFGYAQALRTWRENPAAKVGLERCLVHMVEIELRRGNSEAARVLMREFTQPHPEFEPRLSQIDARKARDAHNAAAIERMEHDRDYSVGASTRNGFMIGLILLAVTVTSFLAIRKLGGHETTTGDLMMFGGVILGVVLLGLVLLRRELLSNAINRSFGFSLVTTLTLVQIHRSMAHLMGTRVHEVLGFDLLIFTATLTVLGISTLRIAFVGSFVTMLGSVIAVTFPSRAEGAFTVSAMLVLGLLIVSRRFVPPAGVSSVESDKNQPGDRDTRAQRIP